MAKITLPLRIKSELLMVEQIDNQLVNEDEWCCFPGRLGQIHFNKALLSYEFIFQDMVKQLLFPLN